MSSGGSAQALTYAQEMFGDWGFDTYRPKLRGNKSPPEFHEWNGLAVVYSGQGRKDYSERIKWRK